MNKAVFSSLSSSAPAAAVSSGFSLLSAAALMWMLFESVRTACAESSGRAEAIKFYLQELMGK
jgi:hypothetical protein